MGSLAYTWEEAYRWRNMVVANKASEYMLKKKGDK